MNIPKILEFLRERYDEEERGAKLQPADWDEKRLVWAAEAPHSLYCGWHLVEDGQFECDCDYPARVLREVAAKRAILAEHLPTLRTVEWPHDQTGKGEAMVCPRCQNAYNHAADWHPPEGQAGKFPFEPFIVPYVLAPCATFQALLSVYAERPGFRSEWAQLELDD